MGTGPNLSDQDQEQDHSLQVYKTKLVASPIHDSIKTGPEVEQLNNLGMQSATQVNSAWPSFRG